MQEPFHHHHHHSALQPQPSVEERSGQLISVAQKIRQQKELLEEIWEKANLPPTSLPAPAPAASRVALAVPPPKPPPAPASREITYDGGSAHSRTTPTPTTATTSSSSSAAGGEGQQPFKLQADDETRHAAAPASRPTPQGLPAGGTQEKKDPPQPRRSYATVATTPAQGQ